MGNVFLEITMIISLAAVLSVIFRAFKQPIVLAYILTGVIIGPLGLLNLHNQEVLKSLAEIGITLLLFLLGLEIRIDELPVIGKVSGITAIVQVVVTAVVGYFVASLFNFPP